MTRQSAAACIALAALAACRPTAEGRCAQDSDCRTDAVCAPEGICIAVPPSVSVSVTTPNDGASWYSRSGAALDILAQVTRDGTDPVSAVLTFANCAASTCTFPGTAVQGGFAFRVPREVQAVGSAALRMFQVTVTDRAGNAGVGNGVLQIDDAPPAIGTISTVTAGTVGENGTTWFAGGAGRPDVEIAVAVTDPGAGVSSVALHLDPADVLPGTLLDPPGVPGAGGTVHFQLPVSGMRGEGPMRFSLLATDVLGHASSAPVNSILVDAVAPTVTAPSVNYAAAQPAGVCDASALCGRQSGTHLLRDDVAVLSFDVTDCGVGTASASVVVTGGKTVAASEIGADGAPCANGNKTHHFQATVDFGDAAPSLPAADASGSVVLPVNGHGADLLQNAGMGAASSGATSGDGIALLSLWRWRRQVAGPPSGSPVLLPANGRVAVGSATAVTALSASGAQVWTQSVSAGIGADLALGPSGKIYAVSPAASCASSCTGTLTIVSPTGTPPACPHSNVTLGAPPAITTATGASGASVEVAVVVATARRGLLPNNLFVHPGTCSSTDNQYLINGTNELTGVSALPGKIFLSSAATFTSIDQNGTNFNFGSAASYNGTASLLDAPALIPAAPMNAIFGSSTGDLHRANFATCSGNACWKDAYSTPWPHSPGTLSGAPVFDGAHIYTADDGGNVSSWAQSTGALEWTQALGGIVSGPAILQATSPSVLVVQKDGPVKIVSGGGVASVLSVAAYGSAPPVPAIETAGNYGLAYVPDGAGWVWAVNLPAPPVQASAVAWPRPGRDSCNSRSAGAPCP